MEQDKMDVSNTPLTQRLLRALEEDHETISELVTEIKEKLSELIDLRQNPVPVNEKDKEPKTMDDKLGNVVINLFEDIEDLRNINENLKRI